MHIDPRRTAHEDPLNRMMLKQCERALWVFVKERTQRSQICGVGC